MSKYGMTDSGKRQSFGKGMAIRDAADDKPRPDLISPFAEERVGHWLRMGAAKYAERNWENGMPFSRCIASLRRHVMRFQQGKRDEDHLAAIIFNAMAVIHYEEMIARGVLPATLNDMPVYAVLRNSGGLAKRAGPQEGSSQDRLISLAFRCHAGQGPKKRHADLSWTRSPQRQSARLCRSGDNRPTTGVP